MTGPPAHLPAPPSTLERAHTNGTQRTQRTSPANPHAMAQHVCAQHAGAHSFARTNACRAHVHAMRIKKTHASTARYTTIPRRASVGRALGGTSAWLKATLNGRKAQGTVGCCRTTTHVCVVAAMVLPEVPAQRDLQPAVVDTLVRRRDSEGKLRVAGGVACKGKTYDACRWPDVCYCNFSGGWLACTQHEPYACTVEGMAAARVVRRDAGAGTRWSQYGATAKAQYARQQAPKSMIHR
jgi:hypothetical protein